MPFYAVARGINVGIYGTWRECEKQVKGFSGARYKKFSTHDEALVFVQQYESNTMEVGSQNYASHSVSSKRKFSQTVSIEGSSTMTRSFSPPRKMSHMSDSSIPMVYTDGACSKNGRKGAKAGYGVFWGDNHELNVSRPLEGTATNNRAEYTAVNCALKQAISRGYKQLIICTDSQLLIKSATMWVKKWKKNGWKTLKGEPVLNQDLLTEMLDLMDRIKVEYRYVAGHAGIYGNEKADELAREGARQYKP